MLSVLKDGFKTAFKKPLTYIALVSIPLIVGLFAVLYAFTFMTPFDSMKNLPVAVVNLDTGCETDGEEKNYGSELVDSLLETDTVDWEIESQDAYEQGLQNSGYAIGIIIPSDFSERVNAGKTSEPEQANITFWKDESSNYMLATLSSRVENALREKVNEKVSAQYASKLAEGLYDAQDGFADAADGSAQIDSGIASLQDGLSELESGSETLDSGASALASGASALSSGTQTMQSKVSELQQGSESLATGSSTLSSKLASASSVIDGAIGSTSSQGTLLYGSASVTSCLSAAQQYLAAGDITTAQHYLSLASQASSGVTSGLTSLKANASSGLSEATEGASKLASGAETLSSGISAFGSAVDTLNSGAQDLSDGASELSSGTTTLANGIASASSGSSSLKEGSAELTEGLNDGASTISEALTTDSDAYGDYVSNPVEVSEEIHGELNSFGYGFIPFFATLCLWLGSLLLFFIFSPFPSKSQWNENRFKIIFTRWPLYLILVALNIVAVLIGFKLVGVETLDFGLLVGLLCVIGFSFMCIMQLLNLFDIPGKAVAVILVVVQIASCSGTFPAILGAEYASTIAPFLPFTYAIEAMRQVLSGGNFDLVYQNMGILLGFAAGAVVLSLLVYPIGKRYTNKMNIQKVADSTGLSMEDAKKLVEG